MNGDIDTLKVKEDYIGPSANYEGRNYFKALSSCRSITRPNITEKEIVNYTEFNYFYISKNLLSREL